MLTPGKPTPDLTCDTVGGDRWQLSKQSPDKFTMLVVYRGLHCPVCKTYLKTLDDLFEDYRSLGVTPFAISSDTRERAGEAVESWGIERVGVGYGVPVEELRSWGLYISTAIKDEEPARFSEPGLFLIRPDRTLFYAAINSMPFGRPDLADFKDRVEWILEQNYPARGKS